MSTPVVATTSSGTWSGTSATVTQPTVVNAGDLLIIFMGGDGTGGVTGWPAGYNEMYNTGSNGCFAAAAWKDADGTEDSINVTVTTNNEVGGWQCYRITGAGDPAVYPPFISSVSQGDSSSPTPSAVNAPGTKDFLYLIHGGFDRASYMTGAPTGYSNIITSSQTGAQDGNSSVCEKATISSASDTPGSMTTNTSDGFNIYTIAIEDNTGVLHTGSLASAGVSTVSATSVIIWGGNLLAAATASMTPPSSVEHPATVTMASVTTVVSVFTDAFTATLNATSTASMTVTSSPTLVGNLTAASVATLAADSANLKQGDLTAAATASLAATAQNLKQGVLTAAATGSQTTAVTMDYVAQLSVVAPASASLTAQANYIVQLSVYSPATLTRIYGGFTYTASVEMSGNATNAYHGTRRRKPVNLRITKAGLWAAPPRA